MEHRAFDGAERGITIPGLFRLLTNHAAVNGCAPDASNGLKVCERECIDSA
jgi:hypothetical protein